MKKFETIATHSGREPFENFGAVNPPVYNASTILFETYDDFKKAAEGKFRGLTYARHGTQPYRLLEKALAELEGADKCLLHSSGVSAISSTLLALLNPGDNLLVTDSVYYPTREFCDVELKRLGIETIYYDPQIGSGIKKLITDKTKVVFVESPGTWTFELQDIPAISAEAHKAGAIVVADNTWAGPFYSNAFKLGVDISIHSATKYIGGHADFLMGIATCTKAAYPILKRSYKNFGICPSAADVFNAHKGLRTLAVRIKQHEAAALTLAKYIKTNGWAEKILHPALPECPGHKLWKRDFGGATGLFSVVLKKKLSEKELDRFFSSLRLFSLGYSYGGYESLIIPLLPHKIRTATKWPYENTVLRLFVGLENIDDLCQDINNAFTTIG